MRAYCLIVLLAVGALRALPAVAQTNDAESTSDNATVSQKIDALQKQIDALKAAQDKKVSAPASKLTISGTAQVWAGFTSHPDTTFMKIGGSGMRFRRNEIHFDGAVDSTLSYHINVDVARTVSGPLTSNGYLQDMYLQYNLGNGQSILAGQTKLPLSLIGPQSSGHLMTIERPLFVLGPRGSKLAGVTALPTPPQWGDVRDPGFQYLIQRPQFSVQLALTEGAGDYQNAADNQYGKQVTGEFLYSPSVVPGLQLGVNGSAGAGAMYSATAPGAAAAKNYNAARIRGGGSIRYDKGRLTIQSEYMGGEDGVGVNGAGAVVNAIRHGEYGIVGYDLTDYRRGNGYQAVAMADYWDAGAGNPRQTNYVAGINHDLDGGRRRLQIEYVHEHYDSGSVTDSDGLLAAAIVNW
jgi:hypothetical protein